MSDVPYKVPRLLLVAIVFFIAGGVFSFCLAWAAAMIASPRPQFYKNEIEQGRDGWTWSRREIGLAPLSVTVVHAEPYLNAPVANIGKLVDPPDWSAVSKAAPMPTPGRLVEAASGWPFRCLYSRGLEWDDQADRYAVRYEAVAGGPLAKIMVPANRYYTSEGRAAFESGPIGIIWRGLFIDSGINGLFLSIPCIFIPKLWRFARARDRLQSGCCPHCGYSVAGLDHGKICPECGKSI